MREVHLAPPLQAIIIALYGVTGLTSLAYEILWIKFLSLQFGVSIFAVVVTVTAFMAGLGAGSFFGVRIANTQVSPLKLVALLEMSVALITVIAVYCFHYMSDGLNTLAPALSVSQWYAILCLLSGILLSVPALLMGMGFPLLLKALEAGPVKLGLVYGVNTAGAALGALLPLFLLPAVGWQKSILLVAGVSALVSALIFVLAKISGRVHPQVTPVAANPRNDTTKSQIDLSRTQVRHSLLAYAGIGAAALMLEIAWTRLFGMLFLRTEYVVAIILAVFLIGSAAGSLLARSLPATPALAVLPVAACASALLSLWLLPQLAQWVDYENAGGLVQVLLQQGSIIVLLTMPVTFLLGAWLPLLAAKFGAASARQGALLYGANAAGAGFGALLAGFFLTPVIGTTGVVVLAAFLFLLLGMKWSPSKRVWLALPFVAVGAIAVFDMPAVKTLLPGLYRDSVDLFRYEDAVSITHVIEKPDGNRLLLADLQRMDASTDPQSVQSQKNQTRLPLLLHRHPRSTLLLGLSTGISAANALPFPALQVNAVEISEGAIEAARDWFGAVNEEVFKHADVVRDDARHYLLRTDKRYDVIVGDLFHPDLVGRSALLSVQQFQRTYARLNPDGIFVQWLALNQFDIDSLAIILRSFQRVYPGACFFVDAFRLAMVGMKGAVPTADALLANLARMDQNQRTEADAGEGAWTWLGRYWGTIALAEGEVQNEWAPKIEFRLPRSRFNGDLDLAKVLDFLLRQRPHVREAARQLAVSAADFPQFERAYIATELGQRSWLALLQNQSHEGQRLLQLAFKANPRDRWISTAVADGALEAFLTGQTQGVDEKQFLNSVLKIRPDHPETLKRLWHLALEEKNLNEARRLRTQIQQIEPLNKALRTVGGDS